MIEQNNTDLIKFAQYIEEKKVNEHDVKQINGHNYYFSGGEYKLIELPEEEYKPEILKTKTLTGLIDILKYKIDESFLKGAFIEINDEDNVYLTSPILNKDKTRNELVNCENLQIDYKFNNYNYKYDEFLIELKSKFKESPDREYLINILSKIILENTICQEDDGISQNITIKSGIHKKSEEELKPIVNLIPYRTFKEVEQPASNFLIRIKKLDNQIIIGLFEADGGLWRNQAILNIKKWLEDELYQLDLDIPIIA